MTTPDCILCATLPPSVLAEFEATPGTRPKREQWLAARGYKELRDHAIRLHQRHRRQEREGSDISAALDPMGGVDAFVEEVTREEADKYFADKGITLPPGFIGGTIEVRTGDPAKPEKHWLRVKPEETDESRWEVREAQPVNVRISVAARLPERRATRLRTAVIYPDAQIWYWQGKDGVWHTTHDEAALDVALQVQMDVEAEHGVDDLVDLGDFLDFPVFSKHRSSPVHVLRESLGRSIDRGHTILAERRAVSPKATARMLDGNHDARLILHLIDTNPFLVGLRVAGQDKDEPPVLSLRNLLRLADIGWEHVGPYPTGEVWLSPDFRLVHGDCVRPSSAATNTAYLRDEVSTIYGHTHRAGMDYRSVQRQEGLRRYVAGSPGMLCRVDGSVPSAKGGHDDDGQPSLSRGETWDQGIFVVHYDPEGGTPRVEHVLIHSGHAVWRGRDYYARCDADGNPLTP